MKTRSAPPQQLYRRLTAKIVENQGAIFIFAAENFQVMPVTMAANVSMILASEFGRCLIIDLDDARDAVGKAFDITRDSREKPMACKTVIEGLFVWPAVNFLRAPGVAAQKILKKSASIFDYTIVNAPGLLDRSDAQELLLASDVVVVFGEQVGDFNGPIIEAAASAGCAVIKL